MDPYLEHPSLWPDVHNSLIGALRDDLAQRIAPRYYIRLEEHTYLVSFDRFGLIGPAKFAGKPDLSFIAERDTTAGYRLTEASIEMCIRDRVSITPFGSPVVPLV